MLLDDPKWDATEAAHPAWWRGYDHAVMAVCDEVNQIIDGKKPLGVCREPYQSLRLRLAHAIEVAEARGAAQMRERAEQALGDFESVKNMDDLTPADVVRALPDREAK